MTKSQGTDPRAVDPNNPVEIVKHGFGPEGHAAQQQGGNQWAGVDYALVRLLPSWGWSLIGGIAMAAIIGLIVYAFTR